MANLSLFSRVKILNLKYQYWNRCMASRVYGSAQIFFLQRINLLFSQLSIMAMRFGDLPKWALELSRLVRSAVCTGEIRYRSDVNLSSENLQNDPLPFQLLWREPLFDQLIANVYKPGEGICSHVDLMRFEDGIAIISLESECVMQFTPEKENEKEKEVPVYLTPGSLVVMHGEARYLWKHGINRGAGCQIWDGKEIEQKRRTSVTLRKLCPTQPLGC
ncbi:2-oxoglutarate (2OG) and Fe(II)-dependent oxygenase superfamily protein isoform X3 [Carex rostrata]